MYKIAMNFLLLVFTTPCLVGWHDSQDVLLHPETVYQCLKSPKVSTLEVFIKDANPYYLRGDFNGDNKPDYALKVKAGYVKNGVCICGGDGSVFLLGSAVGGGDKFSDMPDDNFLASNWQVYTKKDVEDLKEMGGVNAPWPVPKVKGESIAMIWEDGIALIYWDGAKFKWSGPSDPQDDPPPEDVKENH
jgi:hypothetical protein